MFGFGHGAEWHDQETAYGLNDDRLVEFDEEERDEQ